MKNLSLTILFLFSISLLGCQKSNEEKAKEAIRIYLNENLDDMSSYEAVKFGTLDTLYTFNDKIILTNNPNHPLRIVNNKKFNLLGFFDDYTGLVTVYDSLRFNLIFVKSQIVLFDKNDNQFYNISFKAKEKIQKNGESNLPKIESQNKLIVFSKLGPNQYEMFHSYRLKDEKGVKFLTKGYFKLNNKIEVIGYKTNSYSFNSMAEVGFGTNSDDTAVADTAAAR